MANSVGGVIVLGIGEKEDIAVEAPGVELSRETKESMRQTIAARVRPFPEYEVLEVAEDGGGDRGFYLIVVAANAAAPFLVQTRSGGSKPSWGFPRRQQAHTVWLGEHEIAAAYRDRLTRAQVHAGRLQNVSELMDRQLDRGSRGWVQVTVVPEIPGSFELSTKSVAELEKWVYEAQHRGPAPPVTPLPLASRTRFRRVELTADLRPSFWKSDSVALHTDGSASLAYLATAPVDPSDPATAAGPPTFFETVLAARLLAGMDLAAQYASSRAGCSGGCTIELRLTCPGLGGDPEPCALRPARIREPWGTLGPGLDTTNDVPAITASAELADLSSPIAICRVARGVLSDCLTAFGHAECRAIGQDFRPLLAAWQQLDRDNLERWLALPEKTR